MAAFLAISCASWASPPAAATHGCLPTGNGYLRGRLRGELNLDLDWRDAEMECEGDTRPGGRGLRLGISGPRQSDGRRLRFIFGISEVAEGRAGRALPTHLTVIFENESRLFATQGERWCTTDELAQERIGALDGPVRTWRVIARGFCTGPATAPGQDTHILMTRFDFAALITVTDDDGAAEATADNIRR